MKVRTKLIIGFSVIVVLIWTIVLHIVLSSAYNLGSLKQQFIALEEDTIPDTTEKTEIMIAANDAYRATMDYVYFNQVGAGISYSEHLDKLEEIRERYLARAGLDDETTYSADQELATILDTLVFNLGNIITLKEQGGSQSELLALDDNACLPALLDLEQLITSREAENISQLAMFGADVKEAYNRGLNFLLTSAGILTLVGLAAAFFITRSIIRPLGQLRKGTEMISRGNLDYKVDTRSRDEIGQLSRDFDKMTQSLKESMTSINALNDEIAEHKKTEEALKSREQRFIDIAENALEWIWETDVEGRFTYSSPAVEKILGYKPEEIIGRHFYEFYHPEDRVEFDEKVRRGTVPVGPFQGFINRNIHKNGKLVYLSTSGVPIYDADGNILGYRGLESDIPTHKKNEKLQKDENYVLTLLGRGAELSEILDAIVRMGEEHDPSVKGLVMLYDPIKQRLYPECGPNLPAEFLELRKDGAPVRPDIGVSSSAAYRKEQVIVPDITVSPLFRRLKKWIRVATKNNLRACWSQPILAANGNLLGTIINYCNRVGEPDANSIRLLEWSARIAGIAIERKQAERALQESEEKFFKAFRSGPSAVVISTLKEGRFIEVNDSFTRIAGYTQSEIIGRTSRDMNLWAHPQDRDEMLRALKKESSVHNREFEFRAKSGEIRTWLFSAELIDVGGEPCIISTNDDITERKRMEEELRFNDAAFKSILENVIMMDKDSIITYWNDISEKMFGVRSEEAIGKDIREVIHPVELYPGYERELGEKMKKKGYKRDEILYKTKHGEIWVDMSIRVIEKDNEKQGYVLTGVDITERKRAEESLRESEEKFNKAFHASPTGIFITLLEDGSFIDVNDSYTLMTGYSREELIGHSPTELNMITSAEQLESIKFRHVNRERTVNEERKIRIKSGEMRTILVSSDYFTISGKPCIITINTDITERKQMEEKLKKTLSDLEQSSAQLAATNKELESFSYSVSHDLRSPLRSIDGFSQALLEDYQECLDDTGKDYLQRLRNASQKMGELIDGILTLSRLTRSEMHREDIDLSTLVEEIATRLQENQPKRKVDFIIRKGLVAQGDPQLLRALLENLLGNAWKFTKKCPKARIEFGTTKNGKKTTYFIKDNGAGFDMTYTDKLFTAFQRLHEVTEFPGTGIGLATVQRIINRHGGNVWAEGAVDKGATFYFTLN
jgi:PAS domain S-box-containing protein